MKNRYLKLVMLVIVLFLGYLTMLSAEEGVTDTEIHVAQFGALTGPASTWGAVLKGADLFFKVINDEGGINGRKIIYHIMDDSYIPAKTKFGVKQLQESLGIFAWLGGMGTPNCIAVKDYLSNKKIPWLAPLSGVRDFIEPPNKYIFSAYPLLSLDAAILCDYAAKTLNKKKIAIIYQNDGYGRSGIQAAISQLGKYNLKPIAEIAIDEGTSNLQPQALELKKLEADAVLIFRLNPIAFNRLLQASKSMKYETQWLAGITFSDFSLMYKISNGMCAGMITTSYADYKATAQIQKYKDAMSKYGISDQWSAFYQMGIVIGEILAEGIKQCGKDVTRENFVLQLEKMNDFKGLGGKVSFMPFDPNNPETRRGTKSLSLIRCKENGETEELTDFISL
ncbi:MAG: ABC transporter substrate-binding protein [Desulfobacterales bacterium]|nr:ABC transporter substrate-binding protein [Desulfobacterales bacterium]